MSYRKNIKTGTPATIITVTVLKLNSSGEGGGVRCGSASKRFGWNGNSVDPDQTAPRAV